MDRETAFNKVQEVVSKYLSIEKDKITESSSFVTDLGADSLDRIELVMAFEAEFNVEIPDEEAEKLETVKSAVDYLLEKSEA